MKQIDSKVALLDLDGSLADYHSAMNERMRRLQSPNEPQYEGRDPSEQEPSHIEARRKLIQQSPGFWRDLEPIPAGMKLVEVMRQIGYELHVLSKGPQGAPNAWGEKLSWSQQHVPDASITLAHTKSMVYGRVLYDDFAPYFEPWLRHRPRGLVICLAQHWNKEYARGGCLYHPQVLRYDVTNLDEAKERLQEAFDRE